MFSIKDSLRNGWEKFKANMGISLLATLLLIALSSLTNNKMAHFDTFIFSLAIAVFTIIIRIGYTKIFLKINDGENHEFLDIFKEYSLFWKYVGVIILFALTAMGGLLLLIVPGVIWIIRFSFSPFIVVDTRTGPVAAMRESYAITKGFFWKLLLFWIVIGLINLAGMAVIGFGLLVSIPVSTLATIHVYRTLTKIKASIIQAPPVA